MTSITVICPTYRNPKCLDIFLKSAAENSELDTTRVIVVVDGYESESADVIAKYKNDPMFTWIVFDANRGMQTAINEGVFAATSEAILIVNDDNVFGESWDQILVDQYDDNVILTINQIERTPSMFNFVQKDFGDPSTFDYNAFVAYEPTIRNNHITPDGNIFPFLMNKRWFMVVGGFDTLYDSPNICDLDFFLKLELCGFEMQRTHALHFYHFGSVSTKKNVENEKFILRERAAVDTFFRKWKFNPSYGVNNSKLPSRNVVNGVRFNND